MDPVARESVFEGLRPPSVRRSVRLLAAVAIGPPLGLVVGIQVGVALGPVVGVLCGLACVVGFFVWAKTGGDSEPTRTVVGERSVTFESGGKTSKLALTDLGRIIASPMGVGLASVSGELFVAYTDRGPALIDELKRHIEGHPEARAISMRLAADAAEAQRLRSNRELVTSTIAGLVMLAFVLEVVTGALRDLQGLLLLGAGNGRLIAAGQINRLVTANFLHGSVLHLLMNLSSVVSLGSAFERWAGWYRLVPLVFLSGVGGAFAAAALQPEQVTVGMSTAVYGLLGAMAVTSFTFRGDRLASVVISGRQWLQLGVINGLINLIPRVSFTAHLGGFVIGVLAAVLFLKTPARGPWVSDTAAKVISGVMIALVFMAMMATVAQALLKVPGVGASG